MSHVAGMGPAEVMVAPEVVKQVRGLAAQRWGAKRIARELGGARSTVRRYLRGGVSAPPPATPAPAPTTVRPARSSETVASPPRCDRSYSSAGAA